MPRLIDALSCLGLFIHIFVFTTPAMGGHKYFITFIDDYSHCGFFELISEKFDFLEAFKAFKAKVELQQRKKIKVIHLTEVVSIMVVMMRRDATLDHLRSTLRNATLMLNI